MRLKRKVTKFKILFARLSHQCPVFNTVKNIYSLDFNRTESFWLNGFNIALIYFFLQTLISITTEHVF